MVLKSTISIAQQLSHDETHTQTEGYVLRQLHRLAFHRRLGPGLPFGAAVALLQRAAALRELGPAPLAPRADAQRRSALAAGTVVALLLLFGPGRRPAAAAEILLTVADDTRTGAA